MVCPPLKANPPASALVDESMHRAFKAVDQAFRRALLHQMRREGISEIFPGAAPLILHLGDEDGLTLSELGKRCGLESSTMTPLVDDLERRDIARRARAPEDRRVIRLHLTPYGRELEPHLRRILMDLQKSAVAGISGEELAAMRHVMERIASNLEHLPQNEADESFAEKE